MKSTTSEMLAEWKAIAYDNSAKLHAYNVENKGLELLQKLTAEWKASRRARLAHPRDLAETKERKQFHDSMQPGWCPGCAPSNCEGCGSAPVVQFEPANASAVLVPVRLLQDAAGSINDYLSGVDVGAYDSKVLGRLKALIASAVNESRY